MKKYLLLAPFVLALAACQQMSGRPTGTVSYAGTYEGVLPAADGPGIQTTLFLKAQGNYSKTRSYVERNATFEDAGSWKVENGVLTLESMRTKGEKRYWKFRDDGKLCKLTLDQKRIEGSLAEHYCLKPLQ